MKIRIVGLAVLSATLCLAPIWAAEKPQATVKAAKGPVQITLKLHSTKVKVGKSLWYKLSLKNIGKKKIRVEDWIFKDPWAMHENCAGRKGTYLEVIGPDGKPLTVTWGGGRIIYEYEPKPGTEQPLDPKEEDELNALQVKWKKSGMTEQQQHIALSQWNSQQNFRKESAERSDPARQFWLRPGASTTTFTWAYRETDEYSGHSREQPQVEDYTQLFSYEFYEPGNYRIRAVYRQGISKAYEEELKRKHKFYPEWMVDTKTSFIEVEVLP